MFDKVDKEKDLPVNESIDIHQNVAPNVGQYREGARAS